MTRRLTLEQAQALDCNGCGDCCDSRRARLSVPGARWEWGADEGARTMPDGPRIIPLREVHTGYLEEDTSHRAGARIGMFTCASLLPQADGTARCTSHDAPRPSTCGGFPVFGAHGDVIAAWVAARGEYDLRIGPYLPRCTWADVVVVGEPQ